MPKSKTKSVSVQTPADLLTEKELDLLVDLKKQERKLKKIEKEKLYNANKISKFIYFFFTLQNKGIPVNEIYEKDGVKFIKTDRFNEIMGPNQANGGEMGESGSEEKVKKEDELSFYSDDSYEYVPINYDLARISKFKNVNGIRINSLNFEGLPDYETTDEDEEEEDENMEKNDG